MNEVCIMKRLLLSLVLVVMAAFLFGCSFDMLLEEDKTADQTIEELTEVDHFRPGALVHILEGELNRQGQAVGFHYEGLPSRKGEVMEGTETEPDENGIYEAEVVVEDIEKQSNAGKSTFFPEDWYAQDVVDAINEAYDAREYVNGNTYAGITEEGIVVHMYLDDQEKIISAFPVYEGA